MKINEAESLISGTKLFPIVGRVKSNDYKLSDIDYAIFKSASWRRSNSIISLRCDIYFKDGKNALDRYIYSDAFTTETMGDTYDIF